MLIVDSQVHTWDADTPERPWPKRAPPQRPVPLSALPCFSTDRYLYRSLHPYMRKSYDAFGPRRLFGGTDLSHSPIPYCQQVTLFTEELPRLSGEDLEWVMGRGVCDWLGWKIP